MILCFKPEDLFRDNIRLENYKHCVNQLMLVQRIVGTNVLALLREEAPLHQSGVAVVQSTGLLMAQQR